MQHRLDVGGRRNGVQAPGEVAVGNAAFDACLNLRPVAPSPLGELAAADAPEVESERRLAALGRCGTTEDIAATVAHLAGAYITGTTITVDGSVTA